jgi:hypothetical protein
MKKTILSLVVVILISSLALAQGQEGIHEPGTGIENPEVKEASQGTGQGMQDEAVVSAESTKTKSMTTIQEQNQGQESQIQNKVQTQSKVKSGSYTTENGKQIQVQTQSNNKVQLKSGLVSADTSLEMVQEQSQEKTKLKVKLSNGKDSEIKVMPDTASQKAMEKLKMNVCSEENNCQIELKEVGQGEQVKAVYEVKVQKQAKVLGLFKTKMQVQAQVDAENGEIIQSNKPWWAFLASESE